MPGRATPPILRQPHSTDMLYHAHSGLRYLILLVGLLALVVFAYGLITLGSFVALLVLTFAFRSVGERH